ncbi:MAG: type II toxin-antitoxin system VapC family toxin [Thermoleophilia bacterium]|nr:type II toxin-antitoxin system VapC family toxin [Thermoleophilia bacterium]
MLLLDVNILVYAHREDAPGHEAFRRWLEETIAADAAFAVPELVLSGFLRVVTHPRIFAPPTPLDEALLAVEALRAQPNYLSIAPGPRHWDLFVRLCRTANAKGPLVPDAYLAALAIESGSEWITTDRDFARFPDLHWRHPLQS